MLFNWVQQAFRQRDHAVLVPFAATHLDIPAAQIHILDPQRQYLRNSQSAAVEQLYRQPGIAFHTRQKHLHFILRQNHRQVLRPLGSNPVDALQFHLEPPPR